jgi:hypothetical protein
MNTTSYDASAGAGYALAYREARRGLEDQERSVVELVMLWPREDWELLLLIEVLAWVVALAAVG